MYRKLDEKDALAAPPIRKQFIDGEGFAYLGRNYRLELDDAAMRRWYTRTGQPWLERWVIAWASRMGHSGVGVVVHDLGYRWGSTRGESRINIHWATLHLAPSLIDHVIVHELAHLKELNHTDRYSAEVAIAVPDYERRRNDLATVGVKIWTCR